MSTTTRIDSFRVWLEEDLGEGDHTTIATLEASVKGKAVLLSRSEGVLAGLQVVLDFFHFVDPALTSMIFIRDGERIRSGDRILELKGSARALLTGERVALNLLQRLSGIATLTDRFVQELKGTRTILLDTRKTTPGFRWAEKEAVLIGGGHNHRFGLYDRILIKDNHIDHGGGISAVLKATRRYLKEQAMTIPVEIEVRDKSELEEVLEYGSDCVDRVMLDNFSLEQVREAVKMIGGRMETEMSGGIRLNNIRAYAEAGVDFISVGALTHQATSLDLSLKTVID